MLSRLARVSIAVMALLLAFLAGAYVAVSREWGSANVHVDVVNDTDDEIREIVLQYESCGGVSVLTMRSLKPHATRQFVFLPCGEAGYRLRVIRADGSGLAGRDGYVENGYRVIETVKSDWITAVSGMY